MGLAMLFDRSGGRITPYMRDLITNKPDQTPHGKALIKEVRERWDQLDSKEEDQKVGVGNKKKNMVLMGFILRSIIGTN